MQIRAENIGRACRDFRVRAALWLAFGIFGTVGGLSVSGFLLVITFAEVPANVPPPDPLMFAFCSLFAGVVPTFLSMAGIGLGVRELRRANGLEMLLALFPNGTSFDLARLTEKLGEERARRAYVDALAREGMFDPHAPAPIAPAPPPVIASPQAWQASPAYAPTSQPPSHRPPPMVELSPMPRAMTPQPVTHPSVRPDPLAMTTPSHWPTTEPTPAIGIPRPELPGSSVQPANDLSGRTLKNTWAVEKRLASGGMGAVYTARHVRTGRQYAVKTMLPDERVSVEAIHRFEREAKAASAIGHAGIIAVHDFDQTEDGIHFIVMDLLEGETLEHRLARTGRLAWPEARRIALEIAEALSAAHDQGILHRDLKPSNVFMSARPGRVERAVLVDFGLAKPIREGGSVWVTRTGAIVGTAHYMAPEQARGERVDVRADVYGLGALLYEMIAGVPPFLGNTAFAVLTLLLTEQPVAPSALVRGIPPALDALVLRMLAKNANDRPESAAAFARELENIREG